MFEDDLRRHFIGEIQEISETAVRVQGYLFVYDSANNQYQKRELLRTRLITLTDANLVINILPRDVILEDVKYRLDENNHLVVTDEKLFSIDINEFGTFR